jgi:hypothetical protein
MPSWFSDMVSEVASLVTFAAGASVALVQSKRRATALHRFLYLSVVASLFNLAVLGISGFLRRDDDYVTVIHTVGGHLMLPLVATAAGLWWGAAITRVYQPPLWAVPRMLILLLLGLLCFSNTRTGYLGPSRVDPQVDPETNMRFDVFHRWAVPIAIGTMLLLWLIRLARTPGSIGAERSAEHQDRP